MRFTFNTGGRELAGFKGTTGDCATRAVAIATNRPYAEVYAALAALHQKRTGKRSAREGIFVDDMQIYMASIGWKWFPTMSVGQGCKVHMRADELPSGPIVVRLSRHYAAVIDGVLHDLSDCSRAGLRCVYGYWKRVQ